MVITQDQIRKMSTQELMATLNKIIEEQDRLTKREKMVVKEISSQLVDSGTIEPLPEKCPLCGQPMDCECKNCRDPICECNETKLCDTCQHQNHLAGYRGENKSNPDPE